MLKYIKLFIFLFCLFILLGVNKALPQNEAEIIEISISTPSSWYLNINKDGSGSVGFGSSGFDSSKFPKETFNFSEVFHQIEPQLLSEGTISDLFAVCFRKKGQTTSIAQYMSDSFFVKSLFEKAVSSSIKSYNRVNELYQDKPPVPSY